VSTPTRALDDSKHLGDLQRDAIILMTSRSVRAFAFSYLSVIFAIYLNQLGYSTVTVGFVISLAYASGAVLTALWGYLSDRFGRKNILMLLATLTIVSNLIYIFFSHLIFIVAAVIIANVGAGGSGAGGQGGGPMSPVEQALLAEKCTAQNRNKVFAANAFVGSMMGALGALFSGLPQYLQESWGWPPVASYKPLFVLTILFSAVLVFAYSRIDEHHVPRQRVKQKMTTQVTPFVTKMSLLGMIDNLGALRRRAQVARPYVFSLVCSCRLVISHGAGGGAAHRCGSHHGTFPRRRVADLAGAAVGADFRHGSGFDHRPFLFGVHG
jgi:MFS family permease